jgi:hypothetical protein
MILVWDLFSSRIVSIIEKIILLQGLNHAIPEHKVGCVKGNIIFLYCYSFQYFAFTRAYVQVGIAIMHREASWQNIQGHVR